MARFDHIVLTAANATQAHGYERQLRWRREQGLLDPRTRVSVLADPGGRRVGSLGATLHALRVLATEGAQGSNKIAGRAEDRLKPGQQTAPAPSSLAGRFAGRRILICHSGGDSRRTPAYAAQGKVFIPLPTPPRRDQSVALFDLLLANLEALPAPVGGHVLIAVGDVLLTFDPQAVDFGRPGVTGVGYFGPLSRGSQHGVYVAAAGAGSTGLSEVADFLQKPDEAAARAHHALDAVGRVLIDTGLLSLDPGACARLLAAAGVALRGGRVRTGPGLLRDVEQGRCPGVDLYEELCMALTPGITPAQYAERLLTPRRPALYRRRVAAFARAVRGTPFLVNRLPHCDFFHVGSSRDLLANLSPLTHTAEKYAFRNGEGALVADGASLEGSFVFNSILGSPHVRASGALLEAVQTAAPLELPGGNIVTGLPEGVRRAIRLRENLGLVCLPVGRDRWAAVLYGVEDDFKTPREQGERCRFLNRPVDEWLRPRGLAPSVLWPAAARQDLWEARLWTVGRLARTLDDALRLQREVAPPAAWRRARRYSMSELIRLVNHDRLIAHRADIRRRVSIRTLADRLIADDRWPAREAAALLVSRADAGAAVEQLAEAVRRRPEPLFRARALRLAAEVASAWPLPPARVRPLGVESAAGLDRAARAAVAEAVARSAALPAEPRPAGILHDQVVWVTTPVRIDLAGGWSDTPPISTELGGAVVNAAVSLNGQYPVQVMAKLNDRGTIRLSSIDLGQRVEIATTADVLDYDDPTLWYALPKAALVLAGLAPADPRIPLRRWLDVLGGGLDLTVFSALPKGSGLGTSSILGSAVLACLGRVLGAAPSRDRLVALTSVLEQRMNTGGGWQDQVGGIVPGVKLIRTSPGPDQAVSLSWTGLDLAPGSPFAGRVLFYYTGLQRMARGILHNVVNRYLARDPDVLAIIAELKESAAAMKCALDGRDVESFAEGLERYWALKKRIDPGATNAAIEAVLSRADRWTAGRVLPGAGGGGFVLFVARDPEAAGHLRRALTARPPNRAARFFDFAVDQTGLNVTVL